MENGPGLASVPISGPGHSRLWLCDLWPVLAFSGLSFPVYKKETTMDAIKTVNWGEGHPLGKHQISSQEWGEGKETLLRGPDSMYLNFARLSPFTRGSWKEGRRQGHEHLWGRGSR